MKFKPCLFFCAITGGRWDELKINIEALYDVVDYLVIIDGNKKEDETTCMELMKIDDKENKIHYKDFPWINNFPLSRTEYLNVARQIIKDKKLKDISPFIIRLDDDEHFSPALLEPNKIRKLCTIADEKGIDMLGVRCHGVGLDKEGNIISTSTDEYHKGLIYKLYPHLKYIPAGYGSNVHETYNHGFNSKKLDGTNKETPYYYEHAKNQGSVWERSFCRNFLAGGGGDNYGELQKLWLPFRELVSSILGEEVLEEWKILSNYLKKGNIDKRLKDWMIKYAFEGIENRDFNKYPKSESELFFETFEPINSIAYAGSSEIREGAKIYFDWLHPEELLDYPEELVMDAPFENYTKEYYKNEKRRIG